MKYLLIALINLYQKTLSPDHGPLRHLFPYGCCRYKETCSQYSKRILLEKGILLGLPLVLKRIVSCNPFTKVSDEKIIETINKNNSISN